MSVKITRAANSTETISNGDSVNVNDDGSLVVFSGAHASSKRVAVFAAGNWESAVVEDSK
jgi:hypothetical protein